MSNSPLSRFLGKEIKEVRKEKKITLNELFHKTNISESYLSKIENGKTDKGCAIDVYHQISLALDTPLEDLVAKARRKIPNSDKAKD